MVKVLENSVVDLDLMPGKKGDDMKKSVDGATKQVQNATTANLPEGARDRVDGFAGGLTNAGTGLVNTAGGTVKGVVDTAGNTVGTLGEGLTSTGGNAVQGVSSAVGSVGGALQTGIAGKKADGQGEKDLSGKASEAAGDVQDKTVETAGQVGGKVSSAAEDAQKTMDLKDE